MAQLNCQGLPCPQPVLKCKKIIEAENPAELSVIVDNQAARENVTRFLTTKGYVVTSEAQDDEFLITGVRDDATCDECEEMSQQEIEEIATNQKALVFLTTDTIGRGDDELGAKLMNAFVSTLKEMDSDLWRIVMLNGAVKLTTEDSACLETLKELETAGVSILVCGTCLEFFGLTEKKQVGETTNMLDVVTSLQLASKVIRP